MAVRTVIIAEDEAIPADELQFTITSWGYQVVAVVATGEAAVSETLRLKPDAVIMDIYLADRIDGISAVTEIQKTCSPAVIYTTGSDDPATMSRAAKTGYAAFLSKPLILSELRNALKKLG